MDRYSGYQVLVFPSHFTRDTNCQWYHFRRRIRRYDDSDGQPSERSPAKSEIRGGTRHTAAVARTWCIAEYVGRVGCGGGERIGRGAQRSQRHPAVLATTTQQPTRHPGLPKHKPGNRCGRGRVRSFRHSVLCCRQRHNTELGKQRNQGYLGVMALWEHRGCPTSLNKLGSFV